MSLNFCRFVFVIQILFLFGGTSLLQAALLWQYSSTDGVDTISGTFTTDGAYSDTQGVSTHNFIVTKFETFFHNGVDVAEDFLRAPIIPNDALNEFVWKQNQHPESEGVLSVELNTGLLGEGDGGNVNGRNSIITLAFPGISGASSSLIDGDDRRFDSGAVQNPDITFVPTTTTLTPVPEVEAFAVVTVLSISAFVLWRRRSLGLRPDALA
ncbi:MAG: hypothetical protein HOI66_22365 [Verrucomicrobia bacterium]|jgi:hypothetical protein|nr:hypothetical protein [Verrucomicrobiota bacterium]MDA7511096.1 hypothetical protein [Verrucomicrobiota bacterium]